MAENRIYIIPSGRGLIFLAMIVVMILTAATYNNNLIFILAFVLFSIFVVSMIQTHYNLKGVRLEFVGAEEGFSGEPVGLLFHLVQQRARHKKALRIRARRKKVITLRGGYEDLQAHETTRTTRVEIQAGRRGRHQVPEMVLETLYPLGLFRAWKVFRPKAEMIIYPKPAGKGEITPSSFDLGEDELGLRNTPDGDFGELKNHLPGESYRQIAWKHYARTGNLYTKVHWGAENKHYVLEWNPAKQDLETYLSQLSAWVLRARDENASFELETPQMKIEPGAGPEHARTCWRALAEVRG